MDSSLDDPSAWWDGQADYWVPQCDEISMNSESSSMAPMSLPVSSSSDASKSSRFPGVQSSWAVPVEGPAEDSSNRTPSSASKSHSLAEKRRRDRINAQLTSLRKLIPKSDKVSKAAFPPLEVFCFLGSMSGPVLSFNPKTKKIARLVKTENLKTFHDSTNYQNEKTFHDLHPKLLLPPLMYCRGKKN